MKVKNLWVIVAGVSGFSSVGLAAFGRHSLQEHAADKDFQYRKDLWQTGNQFHMFNSLALLAVPMVRSPYCHLAGAAFSLGILGFSSSMYTRAYYGERMVPAAITQIGGFLSGAGWLFFCIFPRL
uniref:Uncharacterized protein n=1 Tax=Vannella robusta TaxID=1487602 RepID=A0A7S4HGR3_9EUKA|mmetsp:Transcript_10068/g.12390  ORF Transcript_10068/g.12390 Transcript_10068/m.12390 type:complete len:125 (+) Transcript_10068:43-417(+)